MECQKPLGRHSHNLWTQSLTPTTYELEVHSGLSKSNDDKKSYLVGCLERKQYRIDHLVVKIVNWLQIINRSAKAIQFV